MSWLDSVRDDLKGNEVFGRNWPRTLFMLRSWVNTDVKIKNKRILGEVRKALPFLWNVWVHESLSNCVCFLFFFVQDPNSWTRRHICSSSKIIFFVPKDLSAPSVTPVQHQWQCALNYFSGQFLKEEQNISARCATVILPDSSSFTEGDEVKFLPLLLILFVCQELNVEKLCIILIRLEEEYIFILFLS